MLAHAGDTLFALRFSLPIHWSESIHCSEIFIRVLGLLPPLPEQSCALRNGSDNADGVVDSAAWSATPAY